MNLEERKKLETKSIDELDLIGKKFVSIPVSL